MTTQDGINWFKLEDIEKKYQVTTRSKIMKEPLKARKIQICER